MGKLKIAVVAILALALGLRVYGLDRFPVGLTIDEVNIGYNAYSLLLTGRDEWEQALPLAFRSTGDFKPPVNFYLLVPAIWLGGLNEWAVRLPVAIIGSLTVIVWLIGLRRLGFSRPAAIWGGLWLAVLPWHIHFSRYGLEAVTALFFLLAGLVLGLKSRWKLAGVCLALAVWAYHSQRLFVPMLVIFLLLAGWRRLRLGKMLSAAGLGLGLLAPFIYLLVATPAIRERAAATSILRDGSVLGVMHRGNYTSFAEKVFDSDAFILWRHWAGKYLNYFDLRYWFWKGLNFTPPGYPDAGLLMVVDMVVFAAGVVMLLRSRNRPLKLLVLFWLFAGPLPASLTMNEQHSLRALVWLPFFGLVVASGYQWLTRSAKLTIVYLAFLTLNVGYAVLVYTTHFPIFFSEYWQYGFKQIAQYACANKDKYDEIIISETFGSEGPVLTGIPYAYVLFYCRYDPVRYLVDRKIPGFTFRRVDPDHDLLKKNALLISAPWDWLENIPQEKVIKEIKYLNGQTAFLFVATSTPGTSTPGVE